MHFSWVEACSFGAVSLGAVPWAVGSTGQVHAWLVPQVAVCFLIGKQFNALHMELPIPHLLLL